MQTSYSVNNSAAVAGMPVGDRETVARLLPLLPQITNLVLTNSSEAGDYVINVVDDATGQSYSATATISGATEATSLNEIGEAIAASGPLNNLFSYSDDNTLTGTLTARHPGRDYTITVTPPGSMATTVTITQAAGGNDIGFGRLVARGDADGEIAELDATTTASEIVGLLFRTDGNHFHSLENDTPSAEDLLARGKYLSVMQRGRCWVTVEDAVTPASTPYVRRAQTSSAGTVGALRATAAGSTQVATITAIADHGHYAVQFGYAGQDYVFSYTPTDVTTSTDDAIDGLEDAAAGVVPTGVSASAASATATMTLTAAAGTSFDYVRNVGFALDAEAASTTVSVAAADVDTIDVSSICEFESTAAAGGLALLRMKK